MGPVLTVHLAVRIRDNEHQGPAQSFMHRSYPTRAERSHVHMYKWWSRIRWSFMRDERWEMRALATQQEERWVQDGFMGECVLGEARKWSGYWQVVRERAIPNGRKAVKESKASCCLTLEPSPPLPGPHIWPSLTICFYCKSPPLLKGPWCSSGWMAPNQYRLFLVCL